MRPSLPPNSESLPQYLYSCCAPYVIPPVAASVAIIPCFYGAIVKTAQQAEEPVPRIALRKLNAKIPHITLRELTKRSFKASPTVGCVIGTQVVVQGLVEKVLKKSPSDEDSNLNNFSHMLISSVIVGAASIPGIAAYNGQTMGRHVIDSLKMLSRWEAMAILTRQVSLVFSLRITEPLNIHMKELTGDKMTLYGSATISGMIGSIIGHPADTALTRWQKNLKIKNLRQLMNGAVSRTIAGGAFAACYIFVRKQLESIFDSEHS